MQKPRQEIGLFPAQWQELASLELWCFYILSWLNLFWHTLTDIYTHSHTQTHILRHTHTLIHRLTHSHTYFHTQRHPDTLIYIFSHIQILT